MGKIGVKRPDLAARNVLSAIHRMTGTKTFKSWQGIKERCLNINSKDFENYGGRGIKVCDRWANSFLNFLEDMGEQPEGMSIDRIDNNGNYEKSNCRWATVKQQANNRRTNVLITYGSETLSIAQWAERTGIERKTLEYRIRVGWDVEKALTTPSLIKRK